MAKVKVTKEIAGIIEKAKRASMFPEIPTCVLYHVMKDHDLTETKVNQLEKGTITLAEAIENGYEIDLTPTEFYSFKDIVHLAMTKGVKFNLWDDEENDTHFVYPIYYKNGEGFLFESVAGGYVRNQHFRQSSMKEDKWFIVEEEDQE